MRLKRLLLIGSGSLLMLSLVVFSLILASQQHIVDLSRDTRDRVLPSIVAQNNVSRQIERLILFGELVLNSRDPVKRRQGRLSAQMLVSDPAFRFDADVKALVLETARVIGSLAEQRDHRDRQAEELLKMGLKAQKQVPAAALQGDADGGAVGMVLVRLLDADSNAQLEAVERDLGELIHQSRDPAAVALMPLMQPMIDLARSMLAIDRTNAETWDGMTARLKRVTDTVAARAEILTGDRFSDIEGEARQGNLVAAFGLSTVTLLLAAAIWLGNRMIARPLIAATGILEAAPGGEMAAAPRSGIAEVASIIAAARSLAENTRALDEERRKVVQIRLEAAAQRERDLRILVAQRTEELEHAKDRAEAANRAKSAFLATMSHELRTPLNAVMGFSKLMLGTAPLRSEDREYLRVINRSGEHLLQLINDVLDMSKIEAGQTRIDSTPFDLHGLVADVADMIRVRAAENRLELITEVMPEVPRCVRADAVKLRQVLINLLGNSVKFTDTGGVALRLGIGRPIGDDKVQLVCEVEDTGAGIAEADLQRIFEPFEQAGPQSKGTGLGLAITRQFIELMGGHVSVRSKLGKGSVFRFELPVEVLPDQDGLQPAAAPRRVLGLTPGQPEYRVLIVEDHPDNRLLLARLLQGAGFMVREACDGEEALRQFAEWTPHLIWMDRRMPKMDGLEATRRIRAMPGGRDVIIVALTASAFLEQERELADAGCDDCVRKPYRPDEIFDAIARLLGVSYRYADEPLVSPSDSGALDRAALERLPEDLRAGLLRAVQLRSFGQATQLAKTIADQEPGLGRALGKLVAAFDWSELEKFLTKKEMAAAP
jgi:signal transduction histidine kinase/ActR/RegA family two-component response regulator